MPPLILLLLLCPLVFIDIFYHSQQIYSIYIASFYGGKQLVVPQMCAAGQCASLAKHALITVFGALYIPLSLGSLPLLLIIYLWYYILC